MVEENIHYFKRNVRNSISVRFFYGDKDGVVLNELRPIVEILESNLKVFKEVNKGAILQGLLVEVNEPASSWETDNALTDEDIADLLSNWLKLKNRVPKITSVPILYKLLEAANDKGSNKKITTMISDRILEVEPSNDLVERGDMAGTQDVGNIINTSP